MGYNTIKGTDVKNIESVILMRRLKKCRFGIALFLLIVASFWLFLFKKDASFPRRVDSDIASGISSLLSGLLNSEVVEVEELDSYEACRKKRLERLEKLCPDTEYKKYVPYSEVPFEYLAQMGKYMMVDKQHRAIIFPLFKSGSRSWRVLFLKSFGLSEQLKRIASSWEKLANNGLPVLASMNHSEAVQYLNDFFFIVNVRHPYTRLESAFRHRFLRHSHEYRKTARDIIQRFRTKPIDDDWPTFEEFLAYVVDREHRKSDGHWGTIEEFAHPCFFRYSHIAKTETTDLDMEYISEHVLRETRETIHVGQTKASNRNRTSELLLFNDIMHNEDLLYKVHQFMATDMKLFGYTLNVNKSRGIMTAGCEEYGPNDMCC